MNQLCKIEIILYGFLVQLNSKRMAKMKKEIADTAIDLSSDAFVLLIKICATATTKLNVNDLSYGHTECVQYHFFVCVHFFSLTPKQETNV